MSIEQMREYVASYYIGVTWKDQVKKMPDAQIIAIYKRILEQERRKQNEK